MATSTERVFAIPELLEPILLCLLEELSPLSYQEDPRCTRVYNNAEVLQHVLSCTQVCKQWQYCIQQSVQLQRALFLLPDSSCSRSWTREAKPPLLNPIVQTLFKNYHFRFWHLVSDGQRCAYMIVERRDLPDVKARAATGQGGNISNMLLSQPPCLAMEATVWDERDETKEYVGRTTELKDPIISNAQGLTLGMVHAKVAKMFAKHPDVSAIKSTTV